MARTALLALVALLVVAGSAAAQIPRDPYPAFPQAPLSPAGSCDPAGNIEEVPFEASSVPLEDWLKEREARQIPMDMRVREPQLRMDQQTAVFYDAKIHLKNRGRLEEQKVVFFVGVDSAEGKRLTETSVHAVNIPPNIPGDFDLAVLGCIYFRPGNYSLWVAAHDESTGKHSVQRQKVRVPEIKNDPLPLVDSKNPDARFPDYTPDETELDKVIPTPLFLPVENKRPLAIDIIILSPYQRDGIGPLTQLALKDSSISVVTLDLEAQRVVYDNRVTGRFDFTEMLKAADVHKEDQTIDLSALLNGDDASYLRKFFEQRMKNSDGTARVIFVVSPPITFHRGSNLSAIALDDHCNCKLFHLQMSPRGGRDDLEKILKSPQSRRLEVTTPLDLRKHLADIIRELEAF